MMIDQIFSGVWKLGFGNAEAATPVKLMNTKVDEGGLKTLPLVDDSPIDILAVTFKQTTRGIIIELPLFEDEDVYGFGLQLKSHCQTGKKKVIRVNSDPIADTGDSHAPVPFYLSTNGYGVFVDTARYATFYCGSHQRRENSKITKDNCNNGDVATSTDELYGAKASAHSSMMIEIPAVKGVDIYIFGGPSMKNALQRYNLFSGGGCLPPMWGLGILYRGYAKNNQEDTLELAKQFRDNHIPCDVFGLEPGWMDKSYSCNFLWNKENFPDPDKLIEEMRDMNYELNIWEQLFIHPTAPFYKEMKKYSGDFDVWEGLVPDFSLKEARDIYSKHQYDNFIEKGILGVKVDECDNSDFIRFPWSFPETSEFPSGMDGEQMHSCFGRLGQETILQGFRKANKRTYSNCRSSHALASSYPIVIYSDLYDHDDFIRGTVNAGFSGLLWTPEVRRCKSTDDLIRRIQTVIFSPMALINAWTIKNPPWLQFNEELNNKDILLDNAKEMESICRKLFELRMSFIPYLYSAFAEYRFSGIPPFRALVIDYPKDKNVREIDDQYMIGNALMFAPLTEGNNKRNVYFPAGEWYDFFNNKKYSGGRSYEFDVDIETMLLFVKNNTLLPLAEPLEYIEKNTTFNISIKVYGDSPEAITLFNDDGYTYNYEHGDMNSVKIKWDLKNKVSIEMTNKQNLEMKYAIKEWKKI